VIRGRLRGMAAHLIWEVRFAQGVRQKSRQFKDDRNYNLTLIRQNFSDRTRQTNDDTALLERIIVAYNKAKVVQQAAGPSYQVSNEWVPIYETQLGEVMRVLKSRNIVELRRIYGNFFRDRCSSGLIGLPVDMHKHYFTGDIGRTYGMLYMNDAIHRYALWKSLLGNTHTVADLVSPDIGNPYGYFIDGTFIKAGADYMHYYATLIARLVRGARQRVVLELGGGFGGMAYYLVRDTANLTYVDFDLPENAALTAYYLLNAFPDKKVLLFGEADLTPEALSTYHIIIMPSFEITKLPERSADLAFNSYSLAEMSRGQSTPL
jgi:hypothetical protein